MAKVQEEPAEPFDWIEGDMFGVPVAARAEALRAGGPDYLTRVFRASGVLTPANRVTRISQCEEWDVGGTGSKLLLTVEYEAPAAGLPTELFVKFSRNFTDVFKDRPRFHMQSEVRLALLSRTPGFPVAVPICLFADFHAGTGTGILITERIAFGRGGIERHYPKCADYEMPEPLEHYRALIRAVARLAGTHKAGGLPASVAEQFSFDLERTLATDRIAYDTDGLAKRVERFAAFAREAPQLLPAEITSPAFIARFAEGAALFLANETAIKQLLHSRVDLIALCHWNANIDNAWFWRTTDGTLDCGLLDWGSVGQMHVAMTLWGCLSGAEPFIWNRHLHELLALFADEFEACGAPAIDHGTLTLHFTLYVAMMGITWLMDAPARVRREIIDLGAVESRFDTRFAASETARVQLLMMSNFLGLWCSQDVTGVLEHLFVTEATAATLPR